MELVFSDEFNTDGRSFFPGDDPYWEASGERRPFNFSCFAFCSTLNLIHALFFLILTFTIGSQTISNGTIREPLLPRAGIWSSL